MSLSGWALPLPGDRPGKPLSNMSMTMLLRRMGRDNITVHGFRSTFRDWAGDETHFPREVAEAALAHVIGDEAEQAYRRGDALAKRRALMQAWAEYIESRTADNIVPLDSTGIIERIGIGRPADKPRRTARFPRVPPGAAMVRAIMTEEERSSGHLRSVLRTIREAFPSESTGDYWLMPSQRGAASFPRCRSDTFTSIVEAIPLWFRTASNAP